MSGTTTINVAVVEDDVRLRRTVAEVLDSSPDCRCVGVFANGARALAGLPGLKPDVILMDNNLPDTNGVELVAQLSPMLPQTQILMLTVYQDPDTIVKALAAGAHGYLVKPVMPDMLLAAIREVRAGGAPMTGTIARKVIEMFKSQAAVPRKKKAEPFSGLAPREMDVLNLFAENYSYKEIGDKLGIGPTTVGTYVTRIYEKLHVHSRREIVEMRKP